MPETSSREAHIAQAAAQRAASNAMGGEMDGIKWSAGMACEGGIPVARHAGNLLIKALQDTGHITGELDEEAIIASLRRREGEA